MPAWLISSIIHTLVLVLLSYWSYQRSGSSAIALQAQQSDQASQAITFQVAQTNVQQDNISEAQAEQPIAVDIAPQQTAQLSVTPIPKSTVLTKDQHAMVTNGGSPTEMHLLMLPGGGLEGRSPEGRKEFGERFGATPESEQAVDLALQWLINHQRPNGSWSFNLDLDPCNGRCRHSKKAGDTPTPSTGATGLALLALLGAGHTHKTGPYADNIRDAIYYLRSVAGETQFGLDWQHGSMYGHGIALMALGEACSMTADKDGNYDSDLHNLVTRGSVFTASAQHSNGSWGYVPGRPGDTTLTGWQVLSLIAVRRNGISLPSPTLPNAKKFIRTIVATDEFEFGYQSPEPETTTTAIGLTLMLYLGQRPGMTLFDESLDRLANRGPTLTNVYHDYYGSLALHHAQHKGWERWNNKLRDHLVRTQATEGHEIGSWHFKDKWGDKGGRLYTTCMSAMMLEIYYRYLPLYDPDAKFPL